MILPKNPQKKKKKTDFGGGDFLGKSPPKKKKKVGKSGFFFWGVFLLELRCSHSSEQSDPSQPERDSIGQTPKEKGSIQHGKRKK